MQSDVLIMIVVGIAIGAIAGVVPMIVIARMRSRVLQQSSAAASGADLRVAQERCQTTEADVVRLRAEIVGLQAQLSVSVQKAAGFEGQAHSLDQRVNDLKADIALRERKIDELTAVVKQNRGEIAQLQTQLESSQKQADEKLTLLTQARDQLKAEFQNLANSIFDEKTKKFSEQSKANLDLVLNPLRDQLGDFRKKVEDVYVNESKDRQAIFEHIKILTTLNQQVSKEADNLTRALKGESKTQGNWGEMILERALELSGLKKGAEYDTQVCSTGDDGSRQLPDVVVHFPEGRDLVVDSKVTLTAYEASVSAPTDEEREAALARHVEAVHRHIDQLSGKSYETLSRGKSLDYVLLFMPIEAAFVAAICREPGLFENAFRKRVVLVSPSTLLVTLRTIQNMWQSEYQSRNAQEIARRASDLYDKFAGFVETLTDVKKAIDSAAGRCDNAIGQLSTGKGNLVRRIENFKQLGVKPKRALPATMVDAAHESDAPDDPDTTE
jgi:DNA recombination protein RmuC